MSSVTDITETSSIDHDALVYDTLIADVLDNIELSYILAKISERYTADEIDSAWIKARENVAKCT